MSKPQLTHLPSNILDSQAGRKKPKEEIIYVDINQYDYKIYGVPISWLRTKNNEEAFEWYATNCPYFGDDVLNAMAEFDFTRKVTWELDNMRLKV